MLNKIHTGMLRRMCMLLILGLALFALFGWWWVDKVAALVFLVWLGRETWEAWEEVNR